MSKVDESYHALTGEPNNDSPLNTHAAKLWDNQDEYKRVLHKKYAEAQKSWLSYSGWSTIFLVKRQTYVYSSQAWLDAKIP